MLKLFTEHRVPEEVGSHAFSTEIRAAMKSKKFQYFRYCSPVPRTGVVYFQPEEGEFEVEDLIFFFDIRHKPVWLSRERQAKFSNDLGAPHDAQALEDNFFTIKEFFGEDYQNVLYLAMAHSKGIIGHNPAYERSE